MKTPLDYALERARAYWRNRGSWTTPPTWEEAGLLVEAAERPTSSFGEGYDVGYSQGLADGLAQAERKAS